MGTKKPTNGGSGSTFEEVGGTTLEMFSEDHIALNKELLNHPILQTKLSLEIPDGEEGLVLGAIAAYCNVTMDGVYQREEIEHLYPLLVQKLRKLRQIRLH